MVIQGLAKEAIWQREERIFRIFRYLDRSMVEMP